MALKRNKCLWMLLMFFAGFAKLHGQYEDTTTTYQYAQPQFDNGSETQTGSSEDSNTATVQPTESAKDAYTKREPEGKNIDKEKVKERADKLDYSEKIEKEKKKDENKKTDENRRREGRRSTGGSFWLGGTGKSVAYALAIAALIALVVFALFRLSKKTVLDNQEIASVHSRDIVDSKKLALLQVDELLAQAIEQGNLRLAVRLLYLNSLKLLMEKGLLRPSPEKTNFDYVRELAGNPNQQEFRHTTRLFEKIWYGDFDLDRKGYQVISNAFAKLQDNIRLGK